MDASNDPWSPSPQPSNATTADNPQTPNFASFSLLSGRKVFEARTLPRKKLHTLIYGLLVCLYGLITVETIWLFLESPQTFTRADFFLSIVEATTVIWIIRRILQQKQLASWTYQLHQFTAVVVGAYLWCLILMSPLLLLAFAKPNHELLTWYQDDLFAVSSIICIALILKGTNYFRVDLKDE